MTRSTSSFLAAALVGLATSGTSAAEAEWPQFLGPNRNGISSETGLADAFPASGPKQVWRVPAGVGMSGLAVSGGNVVADWPSDVSRLAKGLTA